MFEVAHIERKFTCHRQFLTLWILEGWWAYHAMRMDASRVGKGCGRLSSEDLLGLVGTALHSILNLHLEDCEPLVDLES